MMTTSEEFQLFMTEAEERRVAYAHAKERYERMVDDEVTGQEIEEAADHYEEQRERFEEIVKELATFGEDEE